MSRIIKIGHKTNQVGKTVFEILANLKNFGIGRVLVRNELKSEFPEPTFYRIVRIEPQMDDELIFGRVWVDEVYRGRRYPYITEIKSYYPDYSLIAKDEEPDFSKFPVLGVDKSNIRSLPSSFKVPPLMAEFLNRKKLGFHANVQLKGLKKEVHGYDAKSLLDYSIPTSYLEQESPEFDFYYRVADESKNEKADLDLDDLFPYKNLLESPSNASTSEKSN
jgi:small subunit ribosomal protein S34